MSAIPNVSPDPSAKTFVSFCDFLKNDPKTKRLIEESVKLGSVCSINLSNISLDVSLDTNCVSENSAASVRKVK